MQQQFVKEFRLHIAEKITGALGILLGIFVWFYTNYKGWGARAKSVVNNPGFFPHVVAAGLVVLGIALMLKSLAADKEKRITINLYSFVLIIGWWIYVLLLDRLGFVLGSILVMLFTCVLWGIRSRKTILLVSVLSPVVIYILMSQILKVKFPTLL